MAENLEKFCSTELYGAALEGSTNFLWRSSLSCTLIESCQLADLKYAIFSSTECKTKNYGARSSFYQWSLSMGSWRDRHQNRCEVLFFLEDETHARQIWLTLRKSYTISTLSKALKRPRNNAGPAGKGLLIMK